MRVLAVLKNNSIVLLENKLKACLVGVIGVRNWKDNEKMCLVEYNAMTHYSIMGNKPLSNKLRECFSFPFPTIIIAFSFPFPEFEPSTP